MTNNNDGTSGHPGPSPSDLKIMIVGDSITHCNEGDWTWRYRFWQWFKSQGLKPEFVGPWLGTHPGGKPKPPHPAKVPSDPDPPDEGPQVSGGYALDCDKDFDSHHFSASGRQVAQAKGMIEDVVREYQPNMLVVMLGVNDMVWWASDAKGTVQSMKEFIENARSVNPKMAFAIGNVPVLHAFHEGRPDLKEHIPKYNKLIKEVLPEWSTKESPIVHVDVASIYICDATNPEAGDMDGLHPGPRGDFQIARAYSIAMHDSYKLGKKPLEMPDPIPQRDLSIPKNINARGSPMGVLVTWDNIYGGRYEIADRTKGSEKWGSNRTEANRHDTTMTGPGTEWEYKIRSYYGRDYGDWSDVVSAVAKKETAPPPKITKVHATPTGFDIEWERPEGDWNISQYEVIWFDNDKPGTFPGAVGVRGTSASVTEGLDIGHRFSTIMTTWTDPEGGSNWGGGRPFVVGARDPATPKGLKVKFKNFSSVELTWEACESVAGYLIYKRSKTEHGSQWTTDDDVVRETKKDVGSLTDPWELEFAVSAVNGTVESERSKSEVPKRHP